jgi:hypothetical protein
VHLQLEQWALGPDKMTTAVTPEPHASLFGHLLEVIGLHAIRASDGVRIRHNLAADTIVPIPNDNKGLFFGPGGHRAFLTTHRFGTVLALTRKSTVVPMFSQREGGSFGTDFIWCCPTTHPSSIDIQARKCDESLDQLPSVLWRAPSWVPFLLLSILEGGGVDFSFSNDL